MPVQDGWQTRQHQVKPKVRHQDRRHLQEIPENSLLNMNWEDLSSEEFDNLRDIASKVMDFTYRVEDGA